MKSHGFTKLFFVLCSVIFILVSAVPVYAVHFTTPPKSNIFMHMASASVQINNVSAPDNAEIGVFNSSNVLIGTQIVSGGILPDTTINGFNTQAPAIPGATAGEVLSIKVWDPVAQKEYSGIGVILASPASGTGPYVPATLPLTYTTNAFVLLNINTQSFAPAINVSPNPLSFGSVQVGSANDQTVTVANNGNSDLSITGIATTNQLSAPFSITGGTCGATATLANGSSCSITVHFAPTTTAGSPFTGIFNITSNDAANAVITVNVNGTATSNSTPQITVHTSTFPGNDLTVKFWQLATNQTATAHVEVENTGTADLVLGTINWVTPPATNPFSLQSDNCSGQTISAGNSCVLDVVFAPTTTGSFSIALGIPSNDPASPATVTVSGNAVAPGTPTPAPVRNYPKDGDTTVPTSFAFEWHKSLVNGTISYEVCYWVDGNKTNTLQCIEPVTATASLQKKGVMFAGAGTGILFFGIAFAGVVRSRRQLLMIIGLLILTSLFASSCGGGSNKVATPSDLVNSTTVSLLAHKNYKWVVNASGDGGTTSSDEGHFTTQ